MGKSVIIMSVNSIEELNFFSRFQSASQQENYIIVFICQNYYIYKCAKKYVCSNVMTMYLKKYMVSKENEKINVDFSKDLEVLTGILNVKDAKKIYSAITNIFKQKHFSAISYIFMWNGYKVIDHALRDCAEKYNIKTIYFEIANINNKMFVDPCGTNARSYLYSHKMILEKYRIIDRKYNEWYCNYLNEKLVQVSLKQTDHRTISTMVRQFLIDAYGYTLRNGLVMRKVSLKNIIGKCHKTKSPFPLSVKIPSKYIFFPLQVSSDTQVIVNGNMKLLDAVKFALELAKKNDAYLVIKPHPAERNAFYFDELLKLSKINDKVVFTNENTFNLIKHAFKVVTINSTVGLECRILGKEGVIIGKALYENFDDNDIKRYIMGYLMNIDYWGKKNISKEQFDEIIKRSNIAEC